MKVEPTKEDYQELLKDEHSRMLLTTIVLQRLLKDATTTIEELKKGESN